MRQMAIKLTEDKIKIVCTMTRRVAGGNDIGCGSEIKVSKESKEKMPTCRILQIDSYFDVFTRRATGFYRQAKCFELNFVLETLSSGQNGPHSQAINSVRRPK